MAHAPDHTIAVLPDEEQRPRPCRQDDDRAAARIMVVDDEPTNILVVCKYLKLEGYGNFITTTDPTEAVNLCREEERGRHFDPTDLDAFLSQSREIVRAQTALADERS